MRMPRLFLLCVLTSFSIAANAVILSGSCGKNVSFVLEDDGTIVISGSGSMEDYSTTYTPWLSNKNRIYKVCIRDGVTNIGNYSFYECNNILSVEIPLSVTNIGGYSFWNCPNLASVIIPNSVQEIGNSAFSGCSSLRDLSLPNSLKKIGSYSFDGCSSIVSVVVPNSVYSIGYSAFSSCKNLNSIIISNSLSIIPERAFWGCSNLSKLSIGTSVSKICSKAFSGCKKLKTIYCFANTIPSIESDSFDGCPIGGCTLYVPSESVNNYKRAKQWKDFSVITEINDVNVSVNKCASPSVFYENGRLIYTSETEGAIIIANIKCDDVKTTYENEIQLVASYDITAYASKTGYIDSDVVNATLQWINGTLDIDTSTQELGAKRAILINSNNGFINISGLNDAEKVEAYSIDGKLLNTTYAAGNVANISAKTGETIVLKINGETIKTVVK